MCGLFLLISVIAFIITLVTALLWAIIKDIDIDVSKSFFINFLMGICGAALIITILLLVAIPISRMESKTNAEYVKILQYAVNENKQTQQNPNTLERILFLEKEINQYNRKISNWKTKGQKWYGNKWYYHPNTRKVEYIK